MTVPSVDTLMFNQFQKFLETLSNVTLHHAMSVSHIGLSSFSSSDVSFSLWIFDSGHFHHISPNLLSFFSLSFKSFVTVGGTPMLIASVVSIDTHYFCLNDVYHIPSLTLKLDSISQLCESRYLVSFFFFHLLYAELTISEVDWDRP